MEERLCEDTSALKSLKGKKLVMVFGMTGAGKSTLCNRLVAGPESVEFVDDSYFDVLEEFKVMNPTTGK